MSETFGYNFTWAPTPDGQTTIFADGFEDPSERDSSFKRSLDRAGYERWRWWQWWRWGEPLPKPELQ